MASSSAITYRGKQKLSAAFSLFLFICQLGQAGFGQSAAIGDDRFKRVVLVSIPDRKLAVIEGENVIATFPVAVGAEVSPSPTGELQIVNRVANPAYYHSGAVIASGKDNPVGTRWLGLSKKGYGIHGTNEPRSIGHAASHGCIRLRNRDVEKLFVMLRIGDVVEIRGQRDDEIARVFGGETEEAVVTEPEQIYGK
jgi:lipoprotein-anchoring transpeptidase ErfK/SrfK